MPSLPPLNFSRPFGRGCDVLARFAVCQMKKGKGGVVVRKWFWSFFVICLLLEGAFAESVSPVTGRILQGEPTSPVVVSINHWAGVQQWGLQEADILYESLLSDANGGQTRFAALYHDALAEGRQVYAGPVRSVRAGHVSICQEWGAGLVFTGTVAGNENAAPGLRGLGNCLLPLTSSKLWKFGVRAAHQEGRKSKAPNHMSADVTGLHRLLDSSAPLPHWLFGPGTGEPAQTITLDWGDQKLSCSFVWQDSLYQRFWNGEPHMTFHSHQGLEQSPLAFSNVIIQRVEYEWENRWTPIARLTGSGSAVIFTQGYAIEAVWEREDAHSPTRFRTPSGDPIPLTPGKTYIAHFPSESSGLAWR